MDEQDKGSGHARHFGEAVSPSSEAPPEPGDVVVVGGSPVGRGPLVGPDLSSPLAEDEDGTIPPSPLWAMKDRRHTQWHLLPVHERHDRLRDVVGTGDETIYAIDDGRHHAMIGRRVGSADDGCEYCLIGRIPREDLSALHKGMLQAITVFDRANEIRLCGVIGVESVLSANIIDVASYSDAAQIPEDFLPGRPYQSFGEPLEISEH